jgi:hypothetical protein
MYAAASSNNSYAKNFVRTSSGNVTVSSTLKAGSNDNYANYFSEESKPTASASASASNASPKAKSATYRMVERIDYVEVPLLLRYKLIDKKFGFSVLGGMSTNILINNNVFIDNGDELVRDGAILMARPVNYNGTVGFGMNYQMNKNLLIGIEPLFKYFMQSYTSNNTITSHPYSFGVFTGMIYLF